MNKLYVQSNFHLPSIKSPPSLPDDIYHLLARIYNFETKELFISNAHLDILEHLQESADARLSFDAKTYVLAISCDIEVAMQAQQLQLMAMLSKFEYVDIIHYSPILRYQESCPELSLSIEPSEMFQGNVYVINTHGRSGELDGIYDCAIYNNLSIDRIVIDACSSACPGSKKKPSMVEVLLDLAIKTKKPLSFEVIGFYKSYSIEETGMLACAILGKRDLIDNYPAEICNKTVGNRKEKIDQEIIKKIAKKTLAKPIKEPLNEVFLSCSSYLSTVLLPKTIFLNDRGRIAMPSNLTDLQFELLNLGRQGASLIDEIKYLIDSHPGASSSFTYKGIIKLMKDNRANFVKSAKLEELRTQADKLLSLFSLSLQESEKFHTQFNKISSAISLLSSDETGQSFALSQSGTSPTNNHLPHRFLATTSESSFLKNHTLFKPIESNVQVNCANNENSKDLDCTTPKSSPSNK